MELTYFLQELWIAKLSLWNGFLVTVHTSALAIVLGSIIGALIGVILVYGYWPLRFVARVYTDFVRGTPVLVLVLASFYVLSTIGIQLNAFEAGVLAITVFCSSHVAEIVRGAILAIPRGQTEAAKAIGLTFSQTLLYVLFPQALRQILPTWVNAGTEIVKASTLLSIIGVTELLLSTQQVISRNYLSLEFYFFAGFVYFLINFSIERLGKYVEKKISIS